LPWSQRGVDAPLIDPNHEYRRRLAAATADLESRGQRATAERIAEHLDVSPRTVRRWQQMAAS
jgi:AcrR family transcriptional regulator